MGLRETLINEGIKLGADFIRNLKPKSTVAIPTVKDLEESLKGIPSPGSDNSPTNYQELREELLKKPEIAKEYEALKPKYSEIEDEILGGTAGNLCGDEHVTQAAGDLDEALRMARSRGLKDPEVRERLKGARSELNQMERYDLVPGKVKGYPKEQQEIARWLLPQSSSLRHQINDLLLRDRPVEDLENLTASADKVSSELTDKIDKLPTEQKETDACVIYTERAKPVSKTGEPIIEALKRMVEERKGQ
jgi:hypothetical protein